MIQPAGNTSRIVNATKLRLELGGLADLEKRIHTVWASGISKFYCQTWRTDRRTSHSSTFGTEASWLDQPSLLVLWKMQLNVARCLYPLLRLTVLPFLMFHDFDSCSDLWLAAQQRTL